MKISRTAAAVFAFSALLGALAVAEEADVSPRIATSAGEMQAVAGNGYVAWVKNTRKARGQLFLRSPSGKVTHVNRPGTRALLGAISGGKLVFQEYKKRRSTIRFLNLRTRRAWNAPRRVNRRHTHEYLPAMSGRWLAFGRFDQRKWTNSIIVYNLRTRRIRRLFDSQGTTEPPYLQPGQLSGHMLVYVVWVRGQQSLLVAHNVKTGEYNNIIGDRNLWAPSIRADGTVYTLETGRACGSRPKLLRFPRFGWGYDTSTTLARLPNGIDSSHSSTYIDKAGIPRLLFQRARCNNRLRASDIYEFRDAIELTVTKEGTGMGTVTSSPEGIDCGEVCSAHFAGAGKVTLKADPMTGSTFEGWSPPCHTDEPTCVLKVYEATEVIAFFNLGP